MGTDRAQERFVAEVVRLLTFGELAARIRLRVVSQFFGFPQTRACTRTDPRTSNWAGVRCISHLKSRPSRHTASRATGGTYDEPHREPRGATTMSVRPTPLPNTGPMIRRGSRVSSETPLSGGFSFRGCAPGFCFGPATLFERLFTPLNRYCALFQTILVTKTENEERSS
jgi:hypothetical protein